MQYTYGQHEWHSAYQKKCRTMSSQSLRYVLADCKRAEKAMPEGHKANQYADEAHYCAMELKRRQDANPHDEAVKAIMEATTILSSFHDSWGLTSSKITRAEFDWLQDILDSVDRLYDEGCFGDAYQQALRIIRFQFNRTN
tara:strand:+ start:1784 stop:2206 length:423 start_codon:yes stop_codon:yes gene_type:complete